MKRKIISATLGTILFLVGAVPAVAQDGVDSAGIVQAIYAAIASWFGDAGAVDEAERTRQIIYEPLENVPGDGPEMTPIIVPTG